MQYGALFDNGGRLMVARPFDSVELANEFGAIEAAGELKYVGAVPLISRTALRTTSNAVRAARLRARMDREANQP